MWSGSVTEIPHYYILCDGTFGSPDLRSRFIMGYDNRTGDAVGSSGGSFKISADNLPEHVHSYDDHMRDEQSSLFGGFYQQKHTDTDITTSVQKTTSTLLSDGNNNVTNSDYKQPYCVLAFLMKIATELPVPPDNIVFPL